MGQKQLKACKASKYPMPFNALLIPSFLIAASVGGFAGPYGRFAGAHAIHNGLTLLPETTPFEHGVKVAYGILVQIATLGPLEELQTLLPFYKENQFPTSLQQLDVSDKLSENIEQVTTFAASDHESFILAKKDLTAADIIKGMTYLETLQNDTQQ